MTRLEEPVLRFLPEINAAANATGLPASLLAGVVRVESNGDPNLVANGTRFGLSGVSDAGLANQGVAASTWHDPAANLLAGAGVLAGQYSGSGSWDAALEAYFGVDCDATGVCAGEYRYAVQAWSSYYAGPVSNPGNSGFTILLPTWAAPALAPYQGSSPRPIPLPPGVLAPTPTPQPSALPTVTPEIADASVETPATVPTETLIPPIEPSTATVAPTSTPVPTPLP